MIKLLYLLNGVGAQSRGTDSSLETLMRCMGHYGIKFPIYEKFVEKNKCIHTNNMPQGVDSSYHV